MNLKKPFWYAFGAAVYIVLIVLAMDAITSFLPHPDKPILMPMAMLGLFVLSAAIMGFLFLSEPLRLFLENQKREATIFFGKIVGIFTCFVAFFLILLFLWK